MKALVLSNGEDIAPEDIARLLPEHDLIVLTDGVAQRTPFLERPCVVCGDFDSIDFNDAKSKVPQAEYVRIPDQNTNDLEKAIVLARDRGVRSVTLLGAFGGRLDQAFASVSILIRYHAEISIVAVRAQTELRVVSAESLSGAPLLIQAARGDGFALLPLVSEATVSVSNVKWPLHNETLKAGSRGVSNEATGGAIEVLVSSGMVVVCHDRAPSYHRKPALG